MSNFTITQKIVDGNDALARQQRSVETGREAGAGRKQQADVRFVGLAGEVHPQAGRHGSDLLIAPLAEIVRHGQVLRVIAGMGEERFEEHVVFIAKERQGCERGRRTQNTELRTQKNTQVLSEALPPAVLRYCWRAGWGVRTRRILSSFRRGMGRWI